MAKTPYYARRVAGGEAHMSPRRQVQITFIRLKYVINVGGKNKLVNSKMQQKEHTKIIKEI